MAKKTLLEIVQNIMSAMDSDEITSINDTVESLQVAEVVHEVYDQFVANRTIPEQQKLGNMGSVSNKVFFQIPDIAQTILLFKYDVRKDSGDPVHYSDIEYRDPASFLKIVNQYTTTDTDVEQVTDPTSSVSLSVKNTEPPKFWTSFDDLYVMCNSYDSGIDTTGLQSSKTQIWYQYYPVWTTSDSFVLPIDENLFPYLIAEAKSTCFVNLKQQANAKVEQQAKKQRIHLQHGKYRTEEAQKDSLSPAQPNFGRTR